MKDIVDLNKQQIILKFMLNSETPNLKLFLTN